MRVCTVVALGLLFTAGCAPPDASTSRDPNGQDHGNTPVPTPSPRPSNADNLVVCPGATTTPGFDVSDYDPGTDWSKVKSGGQHFAFIKASEGVTYVSPVFHDDWSKAKGAGVPRGAYHFFHPGDDPVAQAKKFLDTLGPVYQDDLPPILDWEVTDGVANALQISRAQTWLQIVEAATGKTPVIYVGPYFWNDLGNPQGFERYPLFIAHYQTNCPKIPPPWSTWTYWQFTDSGTVDGVKTSDVDHDLYNGAL